MIWLSSKCKREANLYSSSGPTDSLAPPASPYPQHMDPSPVDSNGTESTEIEEDAQEEGEEKQTVPNSKRESLEIQSPDVDITSPQSAKSVRHLLCVLRRLVLTATGQSAATGHRTASTKTIRPYR